jgi:hypothetical protein
LAKAGKSAVNSTLSESPPVYPVGYYFACAAFCSDTYFSYAFGLLSVRFLVTASGSNSKSEPTTDMGFPKVKMPSLFCHEPLVQALSNNLQIYCQKKPIKLYYNGNSCGQSTKRRTFLEWNKGTHDEIDNANIRLIE